MTSTVFNDVYIGDEEEEGSLSNHSRSVDLEEEYSLRNNSEDDGDQNLRENVDIDEYGFPNFNVEDIDDLSADEEDGSRFIDAGFTRGMVPAKWEVAILKGTTFKDWAEFDVALDDYEGLSGFRFKRQKKKKEAARAVCRGWEKGNPQACKVEISARCIKKTGVITIRKVYLIHTCNTAIHKFRKGSNKTSWVTRKLFNHVRINVNTSINELRESMRTFHEVETEAWTMQRARMACREQIAGGSKQTFWRIPSYMAALRVADPEGHAFYQTGEETRFARLYVAPSSSMNAGKYCRAIVGLDGTHTSGKFPMTLLLATSFDAENHIVILAWAVVKLENGDNWCWFLEHFRLSYPRFKTSQAVFISDRDKGLKLGVAEVFPESQHAHCVQHIRTNIKGNIDVAFAKYFKKIAEARTKEDYEKLLADFRPTNDKQGNFVAYVRKIFPESYARHAFPIRRYGHYTSNVVEIINAAIKPARVLPALLLSDYIWNYVMEKHYQRAQHAMNLPTSEFAVTEYANNFLNRLHRESQGVRERRSSDNESLLVDSKGSWVVKVDEHYCDCLDWQEFDFPCVHAIRVLANKNKNCKEYVGEVWHASTQRATYSVSVPPFSIDRLPECHRPCLEPLVSNKKKGKQAAKRKPSWGEQQARNSERIVRKQAQKCGRCQKAGHNARSCMFHPPRVIVYWPTTTKTN